MKRLFCALFGHEFWRHKKINGGHWLIMCARCEKEWRF